jgi:hypothetical protein
MHGIVTVAGGIASDELGEPVSPLTPISPPSGVVAAVLSDLDEGDGADRRNHRDGRTADGAAGSHAASLPTGNVSLSLSAFHAWRAQLSQHAADIERLVAAKEAEMMAKEACM